MFFLAYGDEVSEVSQFHKNPDSGKLSGSWHQNIGGHDQSTARCTRRMRPAHREDEQL